MNRPDTARADDCPRPLCCDDCRVSFDWPARYCPYCGSPDIAVNREPE